MKAMQWLMMISVMVAWFFGQAEPLQAQGRGAAARAAADFVIEKFGGQAAREGAVALAARIEGLAASHGDEVFQAVRKVGPQFFRVVEEAGVSNAGKAVRIMATEGEAGIAWILKRPRALSLLAQYGEEAGAVLVRHPGGIAEPLIEQCGAPAIRAFQAVGPQGGRRLAMVLAEGGELAKTGRSADLLAVVAAWGEKGAEFIWNNKGALATTTVLVAFLANPEPFINGTRDITQIVAENAIKPIAVIPGDIAREAAKEINWTVTCVVFLILATSLILVLVAWKASRCKADAAQLGGGASIGPRAVAAPELPRTTQHRRAEQASRIRHRPGGLRPGKYS